MVRRFSRIVAFAALLCLGLAAFAWTQRNRAEEDRQRAREESVKADTAAARAERESAKAELAAAQARRRQQEADSLRRQADSTAESLRQTVGALRAAEDSVREEHLKAIVERETADHYLRIAGQLRSRQLAQDSVRQLFGRDMYERDQLRIEADSLRNRVRALEQELCKQPSAGGAPAADAAPEGGLSIACAARPGRDKAPRGAP
jgi:hypothetical protein